MVNTEIRLIVFFAAKDGEALYSQQELGAEGQPTRNASAVVLGMLAEQVPNMVCSSADLSNSDKTDGFLNKTRAFVRGDFGGAFFQAGVAELTMACVCIGMMLHGGVISSCGTFFVFSDYMKPAIRMGSSAGRGDCWSGSRASGGLGTSPSGM